MLTRDLSEKRLVHSVTRNARVPGTLEEELMGGCTCCWCWCHCNFTMGGFSA